MFSRHAFWTVLVVCASISGAAQAGDPIFVPERPVFSTPPMEDDPMQDRSSEPLKTAEVKDAAEAKEKSGGPLGPVRRSEDDLVLLDVSAAGSMILQSLPGYVSKENLVLPLSPIAEGLEFPIKVSPLEGRADGWFYKKDNRFSLDVARHEAVVKGSKETFLPEQVEVHDDDLYIDRVLLEKWFALKLDFSFSAQTIKITTTGPDKLPLEISNDIEQRQHRLENRYRAEDKNYPIVREPYRLYAWPFADVSITAGYDKESDSPFATTADVVATGDLFYMNGELYSAMDDLDGLSSLRLTLRRRDPDGELFGDDELLRYTWLGEAFHDLKVRELSFGDLYTPRLPLTGQGKNALGAYVSNQPFDRVTQFNQTTFEGDLLPGWDVELYRNDELLDFRRAGADGRYSFDTVPLVSGLNIIRLVFHGPYAETREESHRILVNADMTQEGKSYFSAGIMEQDKTLSSQVDVLGDQSETVSKKGGLRTFFDYEYGLLDNVALFGHFIHMPLSDEKERNYFTTGIGASLFGVYGRVDGSMMDTKGSAAQMMLQTNIKGISFTAQHQIFDDFLSDYTETMSNPMKRRSEVRVDTPIDVAWLPRLNIGFSGTHSAYADGLKRDRLTQRLSSSFGSVSVSNSLSIQREKAPDLTLDTSTKETVGSLTLNIPVLGIRLRGAVDYDITPKYRIDTVALSANHSIARDVSVRGEISRDLTEEKKTSFAFGLNRKFDDFRLSANTSVDTDNEATVYMNLTFSLGREPSSDSWYMFADDTACDGAIAARAYLDKDDDGAFGDGDEPLPNIAIASTGGGTSLSDENGIAFLAGQKTKSRNNVSVDPASIENPSWVVKNEGYSVIARPGMPALVNFAFAESGEVDGTAYLLKEDGEKIVASNVSIQLVDAGGKVVREERSSFDGYYVFEHVRRGRYTLRVSPDQLERRSLKSSSPVEIEIKGEESLLSGLDFILSRL